MNNEGVDEGIYFGSIEIYEIGDEMKLDKSVFTIEQLQR